MGDVHGLLPPAKPFHHEILEESVTRSELGVLKTLLLQLSLLVGKGLSHVHEIPPVDVIQVQQVGAIPDHLVESRNIPSIQVPLAAADSRPRALIDLHLEIYLFRSHVSELAGVLQRLLRALQHGDMRQIDRAADDLPIGNQRQLFAVLMFNVAQLC